MASVNRVTMIGNLTRDPELRYLPSNTAVANIGVALNRRWKNQQGEQQEETTYVDCEAFGKTAEVINQYLRKGKPVYIEGRLKFDQWKDREGQNRSKLKVVIENFQFLEGKPNDEHKPPPSNAPSGGSLYDKNAPPAVHEDDIPFD